MIGCVPANWAMVGSKWHNDHPSDLDDAPKLTHAPTPEQKQGRSDVHAWESLERGCVRKNVRLVTQGGPSGEDAARMSPEGEGGWAEAGRLHDGARAALLAVRSPLAPPHPARTRGARTHVQRTRTTALPRPLATAAATPPPQGLWLPAPHPLLLGAQETTRLGTT